MKISGRTIFNLIIGRETNKQNHGDPSREVFETVVFVVILVLLLNLFALQSVLFPHLKTSNFLYSVI